MINAVKDYRGYSPDSRKELFQILFRFIMDTPTQFFTIVIETKYLKSDGQTDISDILQHHLTQALCECVYENQEWFNSFDVVTVYYDNGQKIVTMALSNSIHTMLDNTEKRLITQSEYSVVQTADMACGLELLRRKALNKSESGFFATSKATPTRNLQRLYIKPYKKQILGSKCVESSESLECNNVTFIKP